MDCNMRSPYQWDWDNLFVSNPENHKKHLSTGWEVEKGEGIESILPYFSSLERVSRDSTSHSTSFRSSPPTLSHCKFASECSPADSSSNIDFVQVQACTAESHLCLQLGKQAYSEEILDMSAVSVKLLTPSVVSRKKSKSCGQSMQIPRCQIDDCELDLSSAKDYHRKHRVCENHSKSPKVIVGGLERRFCQQCSRLHTISEFDEKKRSCRKRLSHHNARRRKPQGVFPLNSEILYDRRQHTTNMLWKGLSLNKRCGQKYAWGTTFETKPRQTENSFTLSFQRGNGSEEKLFAGSSRSFSASHTSSGLTAGNTKFQLSGKGVGEYSGVLHESQDFHRALSLLSTSADPLVQPHVEPLSSLFSYDGVPK